MLRLRSWRKTSVSRPTIWEGLTIDGDAVHIRYQWGVLELGHGVDMPTAIEHRKPIGQFGYSHDSEMQDFEMQYYLHGIVDFRLEAVAGTTK